MNKKSQCLPVTKVELDWIKEFKKLAKKCPENLWIFSASGSLCIMKTPEDGNEMRETGGFNQDNLIEIIRGIKNDGGDW